MRAQLSALKQLGVTDEQLHVDGAGPDATWSGRGSPRRWVGPGRDGARADVEGFGVLAVDVLRWAVGARRQSSLHDSDPVPGV